MTTSRGFFPVGHPEVLGAIDLGSGSVLLTLVEPVRAGARRYRVVEELCLVSGLGRGKAADGTLHPASVARTMEALAHCRRRLDQMGVRRCRCVATSALRDAPDRAAFVGRVADELGLEVEVLSGAEEARLTFLANDRDFGDRGRLLVVDIGAGSTELVCGREGRIEWARSLDLGSVRHAEAFLEGDPPTEASLRALRADLARAMATLPDPPGEATLVGVAGTVTTLLATRDGLDPYDPDRVHGQVMTGAELDAVLARIDALPTAERRALPGMHPQRADVMPAGGEILRAALERFRRDHLLVSDRGVRFGALYDRFPGIRVESGAAAPRT